MGPKTKEGQKSPGDVLQEDLDTIYGTPPEQEEEDKEDEDEE